MSEYLPKGKTLWLCFDLSNGHRPSHRYVWWFDSRKDAEAHRRWQKKFPHAAQLSVPVKVRIV
jgi:hypothetical protein